MLLGLIIANGAIREGDGSCLQVLHQALLQKGNRRVTVLKTGR